MAEIKHGYSAYNRRQCKCDEICKPAWREYMAAYRKKRKERLAENFHLVIHGTISTYDNWSCRCDECRSVRSERNKNQKQRKDRSKSLYENLWKEE